MRSWFLQPGRRDGRQTWASFWKKKNIATIVIVSAADYDIWHLHEWLLADALSKATYDKYICQKKEKQYMYRYSKDVHSECQALTMARLRCYAMLATIFKC